MSGTKKGNVARSSAVLPVAVLVAQALSVPAENMADGKTFAERTALQVQQGTQDTHAAAPDSKDLYAWRIWNNFSNYFRNAVASVRG